MQFISDSQGGITVSGTSTAIDQITLKGSTDDANAGLWLSPGKYRITGMSGTGIKSTGFALQVRKPDGSDFEPSIRCYDGHDAEFSLTEPTKIIVRLYLGAGRSVDCRIVPKIIRIE